MPYGNRGFLLSNGVFSLIEIGDSNDARGINPEGDIVGYFWNSDDGYYSHAYLLRNGNVEQIDYPGAYYTIAHAVNADGDIVGYWGTSDFTEEHGFLLRKGVLSTIDYPGALLTNARGINDKGDIVGLYMEETGRSHGFLLSRDGTFTTINGPGTPGGNVNGINTRGEIVGEYSLPIAQENRFGFLLWHGEYTTIKYPGVMITHPWQITPDGQHIVGQYNDEQGFKHGFVLSRKPLK